MALLFAEDTNRQRKVLTKILLYDNAGVDVYDMHIRLCTDETNPAVNHFRDIELMGIEQGCCLSPLRSTKLLTSHLLRGRPLIVPSWQKIGDLLVGEGRERWLLLTRSH
jgi:hypothetical protein